MLRPSDYCELKRRFVQFKHDANILNILNILNLRAQEIRSHNPAVEDLIVVGIDFRPDSDRFPQTY
jgi:hypothetical protein